MTDTPPVLERTSGEVRDRAVADANALRQENVELRYYLRAALAQLITPDQATRATELLNRRPL